MSESILTQVVAEALRCRGGKACRADARDAAENDENHHFDAVACDDAHAFRYGFCINAVVDDIGHDCGQREIDEDLRDHEQRRENCDIPIRPQVYEKLFHMPSEVLSEVSLDSKMLSRIFLRQRRRVSSSVLSMPESMILSNSMMFSWCLRSSSRPLSSRYTRV